MTDDPSRDLSWRRDGADWILTCRRRRMGRVVPVAEHAGMYRSVMTGGRLSDMANATWSKGAVLEAAVRDLEWEACHMAVRDTARMLGNRRGARRQFAPAFVQAEARLPG
jgi:hypothetical protein